MKKVTLLFVLSLFLSARLFAFIPVEDEIKTTSKASNAAIDANAGLSAGPIEGILTTTNVNAVALTLSPNPATNYIDIEFDEPVTAKTEITIFDISGRSLNETIELAVGERKARINRGCKTAGSYFIVIETPYHKKVCRKVVFS